MVRKEQLFSVNQRKRKFCSVMSIRRACKIPNWASLFLFALLTIASLVYCWNVILSKTHRLVDRSQNHLATIAGSEENRVRIVAFFFTIMNT